jgi:hypothetical protein
MTSECTIRKDVMSLVGPTPLQGLRSLSHSMAVARVFSPNCLSLHSTDALPSKTSYQKALQVLKL